MKWYKAFLLFVVFLAPFVIRAQQDTAKPKQADIPVITISASELEEDEQSQDISGLLSASDDIFVSTAGYTFGSARFRIRGYDSEYTTVMINGVPMNDMETGRAYWSSWGGLNDATRNQVVQTGIADQMNSFGGIGGSTDIITRASQYAPTKKITYSMANRSYRNRMMFLYATGEMENGWSVAASGSRRWAQEGYVSGTFYDAWGYFLSVEKRFSAKHSIGFLALGAPSKSGRSNVSTQEAYDLSGDNYYNSNWGWQDGKKRNARVSQYNQPIFMLSHYFNINDRSKLQSSLSYTFGRGGATALDWVETGDPRPDYYKNLPSYFELIGDEMLYQSTLAEWENSEGGPQLNWENMYFANRKYLKTVYNANGIEGNTVQGFRSKYIIEDRRNDKNDLGLNITYTSDVSSELDVAGGITVQRHKGRIFKEVVDLLGGDWYLDIDKFADEEPNAILDVAQPDLNNPNHIAYVGDVVGYDYIANVNKYKAWGIADYTWSSFDWFVAAEVSATSYWRTGNMRNGHFPENSYGDSEKQQFLNMGAKTGLTWKINGRNYLVGNALFMTKAPEFRTAYISPRTRDQVVDNLQSESIVSGDISYLLRTPVIKARLTLYYTQFNNQTWARSFYHDEQKTFVNYVMTGVDKRSAGAELGLEAKLSPTFTLTAMGNKGMFIYTSRPVVTIAQDNSAEVLAEERTVYLKNYYVGGGPQSVGSLGLKYFSPKFWSAGVSFNYYAAMYLDANPDRRTEEAVAGYAIDDLRRADLLLQEQLPDGFTLDAFVYKSFKIDQYYIGVSLNVSNILNNQELATGGFEQLRYDSTTPGKFPPKLFYLYGRTFFLNLNLRF
ncbi:MAG: TonB-dependent receptor plug domain-containing protein [Bacteroidales bacterium]|nr:TonB-dependent receptor plug domain-containing protein [Bacteroidales bacterium]MDD3960711.1 TonB-dependent receptor plug domain-containing protein [Bacteroidales bacterium]